MTQTEPGLYQVPTSDSGLYTPGSSSGGLYQVPTSPAAGDPNFGSPADGSQTSTSDLGPRLGYLANAVPGIANDPSLTLGFAANSPDMAGFTDDVRKALTIANLNKLRAQLESVDDPRKQAIAFYSKSKLIPNDQVRQALIQQAGYKPPDPSLLPMNGAGFELGLVKKKSGDSSILGRAWNTISNDVLSPLNRDVISPARTYTGADAVFRMMGDAFQVPAHLYRFNQDITQQSGGTQGINFDLQHPLQNPLQKYQTGGAAMNWRQVSDAWETTGNGERFWLPTDTATAQQLLGDNNQALWPAIKDLASGDDPAKVVQSHYNLTPGTPQFSAKYQELTNAIGDGGVAQKAYRYLQNSKVSFGRDVARGVGLKPGTAPYNIVSGVSDATFDFTLDPTMRAGEAFKAARAAKWSVSGLDDINAIQNAERTSLETHFGSDALARVNNGELTASQIAQDAPRYAKAAEISQYAGNQDWAGLAARHPGQMKGIGALADFAQHGGDLTTPDAVFDWFRTGGGAEVAAKGGFGTATHAGSAFELPYLTPTGDARATLLAKANEILTREAYRGYDETGRVLARITDVDQLGAADQEAMKAAIAKSAATGEPLVVDPPADGLTRMYRVEPGDGRTGQVAGSPMYAKRLDSLPDVTDPGAQWWTTSSDLARDVGSGWYGPAGRLRFVDVPNEALDGASLEARGIASPLDPSKEYLLPDGFGTAPRTYALSVNDTTAINNQIAPKWFQAVTRPASTTLLALARHVPMTGGLIDIAGEDQAKALRQYLSFGMNPKLADSYYNDILSATNEGQVRSLMRSATDRIFTDGGVYDTEKGRDWAADYFKAAGQSYAPGDLATIPGGAGDAQSLIWPVADQATKMAIPSFRDLIANTTQASLTRSIFGGINRPLMDSFMGNFWKPMVLLRPGFILRAAGEEGLATMLRAPGTFAQSFVWSKLAARNDQALLSHLAEIGATDEESLRAYTGLHQDLADMQNLGTVRTPLQRMVADQFTQAAESARQAGYAVVNPAESRLGGMLDWIAEAKANPNYVAAKRMFMADPHNRSAFMEALGAGAGWADTSYDDPLSYALEMNSDGQMVQIKTRGSQFDAYDKADPLYQLTYARQVRRMEHDPVLRNVAAAASMYVHPDQAAAAKGLFEGVARFDGLANSDVVPEVRSVLSETRDGQTVRAQLQKWADSGDPAALDGARATAKAAKDPKVSDALAGVVDAAQRATPGVRQAMVADPRMLLKNLDASAAFTLNAREGDGLTFWHGSGHGTPDLTGTSLSQSLDAGPGLYVTDRGNYAANYSRGSVPTLDATEPSITELRWDRTDARGRPIPPRVVNPITQHELVAETLGNALIQSPGFRALPDAERAATFAQITGDEAPVRAAGSWLRTHGQVDDPAQFLRQHFVAPLRGQGYDGMLDTTASHIPGDHHPWSVWDPTQLKAVRTIPAAELETRALATSNTLDNLARLSDAAARGDSQAADTLIRQTFRHSLDDPNIARQVRFADRSAVVGHTGVAVAEHPPKGYVRLYFPALHPDDARAAQSAIGSLPLRGLAEQTTGVSNAAVSNATRDVADIATMYGTPEPPPLLPTGPWSTTRPDLANDAVDKLTEQLGPNGVPVHLGYVDVPKGELTGRKVFPMHGKVPALSATPLEWDNLGINYVPDLAQQNARDLGARVGQESRVLFKGDNSQFWLKPQHVGSAHFIDPAEATAVTHDLTDEERAALERISGLGTRTMPAPLDDEMRVQQAAAVLREKGLRELPFVPQDARDAVLASRGDELAANLTGQRDALWGRLAMQTPPPEGGNTLGLVDTLRQAYRSGADVSLSERPAWMRSLITGEADDGRLYGAIGGGATKEQALDSWAHTGADHFQTFMVSPKDGRVLHEITGPVSRGSFASTNAIEHTTNVPFEDLPTEVVGPKPVAYDPHMWEKIVRFGFDKVIGPSVNALARKPLFFANYAKGLEAADAVRSVLEDPAVLKSADALAAKAGVARDDLIHAWRMLPPSMQNPEVDLQRLRANLPAPLDVLNNTDLAKLRDVASKQGNVEDTLADIARERAVNDSLPFINDHRVRSQFAEYTRNLSPFYWAQESFLRRWAGTIIHSPEAVERGRLYMMGLKHSGIVKQDEFGNNVYVIPGSQYLQKVASSLAETVTGKPYSLPVNVPFTGDVKFTTPGFDRIGVPSVGPTIGIPMNFLAQRFPELQQLNQSIQGSRGSTPRSLWENFVPPSVANVYKAFTARPDSDAQMMSAMVQAASYLEATGHGLPDNATAEQRQQYIDRVTNWARSLGVMRSLLGFASPAPPSPDIPGNLRPEFVKILKSGMPLQDAVAQFVGKNPDATPFTVFASKSVSGASMATTRAAFNMMSKNAAFLKDYQQAGGWFLPASAPTDTYDRAAYYDQLALGLRDKKTFAQWFNDMKFAKAAQEYFSNADMVNPALAALAKSGNSNTRLAVQQAWDAWKQSYFAQNPIFAEQLQSGQGAQRRAAILDEMRNALADPRAPSIPITDKLREVVTNYDSLQGALDQLKYSRTNATQDTRQAIENAYWNWAQGFGAKNPDVQPFIDRVIRPELAARDSQLGVGAAA